VREAATAGAERGQRDEQLRPAGTGCQSRGSDVLQRAAQPVHGGAQLAARGTLPAHDVDEPPRLTEPARAAAADALLGPALRLELAVLLRAHAERGVPVLLDDEGPVGGHDDRVAVQVPDPALDDEDVPHAPT